MCKLQPRSRSVKVRDINMRYADWGGEGPLLLMLHGAMRTSRSWDAVARALRDEYHVISLDARGHGDSDWTRRGYRFSHRVEDMGAFCRELGIRDATAVGHSNGAVVFAMLADKHPEFFRGLVLLEPMLVVGETPGELPPPRRTSRRRRTWSTRDELREYLKQHPATRGWREDVILDVVDQETMELANGRIDMKWSPDTLNMDDRQGERFDLRPILGATGLPTLFVASQQRASRFADVQPIAAATPNFHFTTVNDTGHNMYMERPDAVASLIASFLSGNTIPGAV